jgi:hypothetical protein
LLVNITGSFTDDLLRAVFPAELLQINFRKAADIGFAVDDWRQFRECGRLIGIQSEYRELGIIKRKRRFIDILDAENIWSGYIEGVLSIDWFDCKFR